VDPGLATETIPPEAVVLDLRSRTAYQAWHYPEARHVDYFETLRTLDRFERGTTHVVYCEVGLKSAHLAEEMRRQGITAFHVQGGLKQVMGQALKADPALIAALSPALIVR
jgi:tRNA uracil 4-sulfurtransferase